MTDNEAYRQLKAAVQDCYAVFSRYPLNKKMDYCPRCHSLQDIAHITEVPFQILSADDLRLYAFDAVHHWGDEYDFKHFLPRLLEIIAFDKPSPLMAEVILSRLEQVHWGTSEKNTLQTYLFALWQFILSDYPSSSISVGRFIDGLWGDFNINELKPDIIPYLQLWETHLTTAKIHHLAGFMIYDYAHLFNIIPPELHEWLAQPTTKQILETAFFSDFEFEQEISDALHLLESYYPGVMI